MKKLIKKRINNVHNKKKMLIPNKVMTMYFVKDK